MTSVDSKSRVPMALILLIIVHFLLLPVDLTYSSVAM